MCSLRGLGSLEACAVIAVTIGHACLPASLTGCLTALFARSLAHTPDRIGYTLRPICGNALRAQGAHAATLHCVTLSRLPMYHLSTCPRRVVDFLFPTSSPLLHGSSSIHLPDGESPSSHFHGYPRLLRCTYRPLSVF